MASSTRAAMDAKRFPNVSTDKLSQAILMDSLSSCSLEGDIFCTNPFMKLNTFSTGLRSGLFEGQEVSTSEALLVQELLQLSIVVPSIIIQEK